MRQVRKIIVPLMAASVMLQSAACSFTNDSREQFLEVSDRYARALASCDVDEISNYCDEGFDETGKEWEERLRFVPGKYYEDGNSADVAETISEALTYELDPDSVIISGNHGSISCTFSIPDYVSTLERSDILWIDDFYEALFACDSLEYNVTLNFKLENGEWIAIDYDEMMSEIYDFTSRDYSYKTPLKDKVIGATWYFCDSDEGDYFYTTAIELDLNLAEVSDYSNLYYEIEYQGEVIKRFEGTADAYLGTDEDCCPTMYDYDFEYYIIASGDYTITFYDGLGGEVLYTDVAHVY